MRDMLRALNTLLADTALTSWYTSVGGRVYLDEAPDNATLPLCVYGVQRHDIQPVMDGKRGWERFELQFVHFHPRTTGAAAAMLASESLQTLLDNATLNPTGYDRVVLRATSRGVPSIDDEAIRTVSTFRAIGQRG
jgi:hypothetical protein